MSDDDNISMPFSGHHPDAIIDVLKLINDSGMPCEVFDAFLGEYKRSGNLEQSISFAYAEWDL